LDCGEAGRQPTIIVREWLSHTRSLTLMSGSDHTHGQASQTDPHRLDAIEVLASASKHWPSCHFFSGAVECRNRVTPFQGPGLRQLTLLRRLGWLSLLATFMQCVVAPPSVRIPLFLTLILSAAFLTVLRAACKVAQPEN